MDLGGRRLKLDNIWVNVLDPGGSHTGHIHPHCILSGTYYVRAPDGASSLKFEDPRLPMMMATEATGVLAPADIGYPTLVVGIIDTVSVSNRLLYSKRDQDR